MQNKVIVNSVSETLEFAKSFGKQLVPQTVVTLEGDLAAGKTTFTKGIAAGLGIAEVIDSPTFAIIKEYEGKIPLYHMDVYRLDGDSETDFIMEYFDKPGVCVIEWASIIKQDLPAKRIDINFKRLDEDQREITINYLD